jgi:hypothetical protein
MSRVTERMSGNRKRVCIQDEGIGRIYIDWDDWVFLQSVYGLSADTKNLYQRVCELIDSAAEPGSRLSHEW